ncbi:hypothetical protein HZH66_014461 [Vespula vulgaris]|uniref:Uncharacterized protein n=1 Tax=Vespula vulgaris TaxID=7454 RepID=A0A834J0S6_VESVU|nr:hypothetical protein HZH66_014461 [Vespula vulgaris]
MYVPISKWDTRYMPKIYWHFVWGALLRNAETAVAMLGGTPSREYKDTIESSNGSGGGGGGSNSTNSNTRSGSSVVVVVVVVVMLVVVI